MTGVPENPGDLETQILVELEPHADVSIGTGT
jgi:hypothetical protein